MVREIVTEIRKQTKKMEFFFTMTQ